MKSSVLAWLQGRKTYLLAAVLCAVTLGLLAAGKLTPPVALATLLFFVGGASVTIRAGLARHHDETLAVLQDVAAVGIALRAKNPDLERAAATTAVKDVAKLAADVREEPTA